LVWLTGLWRARHALGAAQLVSLALLCTILAFTLSGTTRGESGRIWLVLAPFALIAAAGYVPAVNSGERAAPVFRLTALHGLMALVLTSVLAVYNAPELTPPPAPLSVRVSQPADATFSSIDGALYRLTGWEAAADADSITLALRWQGVLRPLHYQWFSAVLVAPDGATYPIEAWQPNVGTYPTTCWDTGMTRGARVTLPLPPDALPGEWYVSLAAFGGGALPEGRLTVTQPDADPAAQIGLGPISVGQ